MKIFLYNKPLNEIDNEYCLVQPTNSYWNDFGIKSKVNLELFFLNKKIVLKAYYAAFIKNEFVTLDNKLEENEVTHTKITQYILLESIEEYDKLKINFAEQYEQILKALNDISYLRMQKNRSSNFNLFLQSGIFNKSFIRSHESFLAYLHGYTGLVSTLVKNTIKISAVNPLIKKEVYFEVNEHDSDINFLPFRHFIMIGRNGTGKSQTLRKLALKYKKNDAFNKVVCFSQSEKSNSFSKKIDGINHINLTKSKKNLEILQSMIRIRFESYRFEDENFDILIDLIENINFMKNLALYKDKDNYLLLGDLFKYFSTEQNSLEKIQEVMTYNKFKIMKGNSFYDLSSGENFFINLIFNMLDILNQYKNNVLFLFDEPESFLHPNFIAIFSEITCYFTNRLYCTAVTATHSIYLVKNSLQQNIAILRNDKIEYPSFNTFGANLNSLSYFIFGFESPLELEESVINSVIELENNQIHSFENLIQKYGKFLSSETIDRIYMKLSHETN